jgi:hypothetical protein
MELCVTGLFYTFFYRFSIEKEKKRSSIQYYRESSKKNVSQYPNNPYNPYNPNNPRIHRESSKKNVSQYPRIPRIPNNPRIHQSSKKNVSQYSRIPNVPRISDIPKVDLM